VAAEEHTRRKLEKTRDLQSVVGTMKALAAVSIQQYERAAEALDKFSESIDLGLQVVLRSFDPPRFRAAGRARPSNVIVLGSDQGMCGRFNEDVASRVADVLDDADGGRDRNVLAAGGRLASSLEHDGRRVARVFPMPGSASGILPLVRDLVLALGAEITVVDELDVVYNHHTSGASYEPRSLRLLPLDDSFLDGYRKPEWPTPMLPSYAADPGALFTRLIRHHLLVALYRAVAHSLAAENASRLSVMQAAEKNVEETLEELTTQYHQSRQSAITEELLEIVSGFTVLSD
jgi:F-type H+-transporting ATPase subunit gamma